MLDISNISKSFDKTILKDISFSLKSGDLCGLVGLNGVGKTTLIKIILDLLKPDSGDIKINGQYNYLPTSRNNLIYLPEKFVPNQHLKGREFIKIGLEFYNQEFDPEKAAELIKQLGLPDHFLDMKISNYSKGMTQKLGIILVMLSNRELWILDEPMSGLDPMGRAELKKVLKFHNDRGNTLLFSTHLLSDIEELCNKVVVIHDAKLLYYGDPKDFITATKAKSFEDAFTTKIL